MLEVGNFQGPLSAVEERTHFGAWCIVSSPLILGTDITDTSVMARVWPIVSNAEAIAVNQQWHGHPGWLVAQSGTFKVGIDDHGAEDVNGWQVWAKPQGNGSAAVFILNAGSAPVTVSVSLAMIGLNKEEYDVRDIWAKKDDGTVKTTFSATDLAPHDSTFNLLTPTGTLY